MYDPGAALRQFTTHGELLLYCAFVGKGIDVVERIPRQPWAKTSAVTNNAWTRLICALMLASDNTIQDCAHDPYLRFPSPEEISPSPSKFFNGDAAVGLLTNSGHTEQSILY